MRVGQANLFARGGPKNNTGKLLLAHATRSLKRGDEPVD